MENIEACSCLDFCDDELPHEEKNHNKALHISIECVDTFLSMVLLDIRFSLNVMSKNSLTKLMIKGLPMNLAHW